MLEDFVKVARTDELSPGQMKLIEIGDDRILLVNLRGNITRWMRYAATPSPPCPRGT